MRKWIWTSLIVLALIATGGLVHAHSGCSDSSPVASEESPCPLEDLVKRLHGGDSTCPLQYLMNHLGF
jgi:hypothetical protein